MSGLVLRINEFDSITNRLVLRTDELDLRTGRLELRIGILDLRMSSIDLRTGKLCLRIDDLDLRIDNNHPFRMKVKRKLHNRLRRFETQSTRRSQRGN